MVQFPLILSLSFPNGIVFVKEYGNMGAIAILPYGMSRKQEEK
jgi:hypothetical protein